MLKFERTSSGTCEVGRALLLIDRWSEIEVSRKCAVGPCGRREMVIVAVQASERANGRAQRGREHNPARVVLENREWVE